MYGDLCRFNHELVFGISVKNLSKAERLIYGDSLMTHAMILTAVTDKVRTHKHTVFIGVWLFSEFVQTWSAYTSRSTVIHTFWVSQGLSYQSFAACLCFFNWLHFFIALSISPLINSPSCHDTFISLVSASYSYLPIACLWISQDGKEGYEKWRVENSWGDDRGNKGNT